MNKEYSVREKELYVDLDGYKASLFLCSRILAECERIKAAAKVLLEEITASENNENTADDRVKDFLRDSIKSLIGDEAAAEVFEHQSAEIANLTAILCCLISKIGAGIGSAEDEE
jgi:hypothetical protein